MYTYISSPFLFFFLTHILLSMASILVEQTSKGPEQNQETPLVEHQMSGILREKNRGQGNKLDSLSRSLFEEPDSLENTLGAVQESVTLSSNLPSTSVGTQGTSRLRSRRVQLPPLPSSSLTRSRFPSSPMSVSQSVDVRTFITFPSFFITLVFLRVLIFFLLHEYVNSCEPSSPLRRPLGTPPPT